MRGARPNFRFLLLAALAVGFSFTFASAALDIAGPVLLAWKGGGVALLAVYAAMRGRDLDGWLLTAVMALGALGDVLIDTLGATAGGGAFLVGHAVAIILYGRNLRRPGLGRWEWGVCLALPLGALAIALLGVPSQAFSGGVALYVLGVSAMAALAFVSRFRRDRVALGAVMFLVSDLLIVTHLAPAHEPRAVSVAIWLLYFGGQTLITLGVTAAREDRASPTV